MSMAMSSLFVCYSRTATIVFLSSLVCLFVIVARDYRVIVFVGLYVCPGVFSETMNSTVTMSHTIVTYTPE